MIEKSASRQFQIGLLALQSQLVSQETLVAAFETWWTDRSRQLGEILVELGALTTESHQHLNELVCDSHSIANPGTTDHSFETDLARVEVNPSVVNDPIISDQDQSLATLKWAPEDSLQEERSWRTDRSFYLDNARFRILRQHAKGGLGVVFVAEDQQLNRPVALKQIREDRGSSNWVRNKFIQEAEVTGQLEHPGVVPIYALGIDPKGKPYYAMRLIQGKDLGARIIEFHRERQTSNGALDCPNLRHLLRRFLDVCNAMEYAHSRGILHRDLKPANVMLGEFGETLVVDWGLAKMLSGHSSKNRSVESAIESNGGTASDNEGMEDQTLHGQFMGTVAYASPEQLRGQMDYLGPCSDVYSLGAILFELLTGKPPVIAEKQTPDQIADDLLSNGIRSPRSMVTGCPAPLESICMKALTARIEDRYQSVADLKRDLEAWLDDEPCGAHPDSLLSKAKRWSRHHPVIVVTIATILVCSAVASAALFGFATIKNRQILAEKLLSESARDDAEAVTGFLMSALESTDPDRLGENVTVAETLKASESALIDDQIMTPLRKVRIASAIMESYLGLGLYVDGVRMAEYMNRVCDENLAPLSKETLKSRCHLAIAFWFNSEHNRAIEMLEKYMPLLVNAVPESDSDALSVQDNLAFMYMNTGRATEAEQLCRSTISKYYKYNKIDNPNALNCIGNLVQILVGSDRRTEGIAVLNDAIVRAEKTLGPTHTVTLRLLQNLGEHITDPSEALVVSEKAYLGAINRYGKQHREIAVFRNSMSANLILLKRWEEVIPLLEESEADMLRLNTDNTGPAGNVRSGLINAYLQTERYDGLERIVRRAMLPELKDSPGISTRVVKVVLLMAIVRQNRMTEARELVNELKQGQYLEELSPTSLAVFHGLEGEVALASGDLETATDLLVSSWETVTKESPSEIYTHVPRYLAIALAEIYKQKRDEKNQELWHTRAQKNGINTK